MLVEGPPQPYARGFSSADALLQERSLPWTFPTASPVAFLTVDSHEQRGERDGQASTV